jgi:hypothetical protein
MNQQSPNPQAQAQKLRLLLARLAVKQAQNLPLTAVEENLLAECDRQRYMRPVEKTILESDGSIRIERSVDATPVMEAMKDYGDIIDRSKSRVAGARMIGSIDPITAAIWSKECGAGIGTREFAKYAKKKLSDPDFKRFRFGGM